MDLFGLLPNCGKFVSSKLSMPLVTSSIRMLIIDLKVLMNSVWD
jgi:hypothetical protein